MKVRVGVPLAEQVKVTLSPTTRVAGSGFVAITTGTATQRTVMIYDEYWHLTVCNQNINTEVLQCSYSLLHTH